MKTHVLALAVGLVLTASVGVAEQPKVVDDDGYTPYAAPARSEVTPAARDYSPYAGRKYPTRVLWGDTHNHTSNWAMPSRQATD